MKIFYIIICFFKLIYLIDADICPKHYNCVSLSHCPQFNEMHIRPLNKEEFSLIINKICYTEDNGLEPYFYVCCPVPVELPKLSECGKFIPFDGLTRGPETNIEEFPWTVLLKKEGDTFDNHTCEGNLINKRYILIAAHCVLQINQLTNEKKLINITTARLGEWNKKTDNDCQNDICSDSPVDINIEKIIIHPDYQSQLSHHDIALLRLTKEVNYTKYIQPICLPLDDNIKDDLFNDVSFDVVGWGNHMTTISSNIKLRTKIITMDHIKCSRIYYKVFGINILNSQICSDIKYIVDNCNEDYGGALIGLNITNIFDPNFYLAGIVSNGCNKNKGLPILYTRVGAHIDWILDNLEP